MDRYHHNNDVAIDVEMKNRTKNFSESDANQSDMERRKSLGHVMR